MASRTALTILALILLSAAREGRAEAYLASGTLQHMDEDVRALIAEHGIRNALDEVLD